MIEPDDRQVRRRYRRRYQTSDTLIELFNAIVSQLVDAPRRGQVGRPRRILLANYGHLGDMVMSTVCIGILRAAMPEVKIGFLIGSWSRPVLGHSPDVSWLHVIDHWFLDRGPGSRFAKFLRYRRACRRVAREIRDIGYDTAVDLRAYFPNALPILYRAGVPIRIGYTRVLFAPTLTHPRQYIFRRAHESEIQVDLLRALPVPEQFFVNPPFRLPGPTTQAVDQAQRFVSEAGFSGQRYRVLHLGAAAAAKDWPTDAWRALSERLVAQGCRLIFSGHGHRDRQLIEPVIAGLGSCANACDRLDWSALVEVIRGAELVYTVDTMAGHITAAVGTPCVEIHGGMSDYRQWSPRLGPAIRTVVNVVPCWPCFQYNGCAHMSCLRLLSEEQVYRAGEELVSRRR